MAGRLLCALLLLAGTAAAAPDPLARAFGTLPDMWGARLSPDGQRVAYLTMATQDMPLLAVMDLQAREAVPALSSKRDSFDLTWCDWASDERLLCGFRGIDAARGHHFAVTRLVAVNADGSDAKVLLQDRLNREYGLAQFQDDIVDWLVDDPRSVLVEMPDNDGTGVSRLDIYTGQTWTVKRVRDNIREWVSDGHGSVRLRQRMTTEQIGWYYRLSDEPSKWQLLHEFPMADPEDFWPLGFGEARDELLIYHRHAGRLGLWARDLRGEAPERLVFEHPAVDLSGSMHLGRYRRLVAVGYVTDRPKLHYFDAQVKKIADGVSRALPDRSISVTGESWDRRFYLVHVDSDRDPGRYYRLDLQARRLMDLGPVHPALEGRELASMTPVEYAARDGASIPGYLTLPAGRPAEKLPLILLPHGGPESRDEWGFDFLGQYLAARGYAVLQANFRGSGGYGEAWAGEGGFRNWRQAVADLDDGVSYLVAEGIADPDRVCAVGWSYGGYAALLSALESPARYRCVVSIAGVTDPEMLVDDSRMFLNQRAVRGFVGDDRDNLRAGSPLRRAEEFQVPVLLFHGDEDLNVDLDHSKRLDKALRKADKDSELVVYDDAEHAIWRNEYRIDMLDRLGRFLEANLAPR